MNQDSGQDAKCRKISSLAKHLPKVSPLKQIRKFCLDCVCGQKKMIRFCCATVCPLWYLRFGKFPMTFIREEGEIVAQLFDPENFKIGEKFDPHVEVEEYKLEP